MYTTFPVYRPAVRTMPIYAPRQGVKPCLRYNHDVDIVRFRGRFIAAWNANEIGDEDVPGQYNFMSVSDDFEHWTVPVRLFMAEAGCENPVDSDNQWQPSFINWRDEKLFCAWCDFNARRTFVAESADGIHWKNVEVATAPAALSGRAVGFPTNHGLITSQGVMLFPCSVPFIDKKCIVGDTRYAGILISRDQGGSWQWSEPVEALRWSELGEPADLPGGDIVKLWEPALFEHGDGRIGMLIRNSTSQDTPERDQFMKSHHMILYCSSDDQGQTWTKATPIEVDSIISRSYTEARVNAPDSLLMVMNDWPVNVPARISHDRYFLSLFCTPVSDPDLLLPGPVVQPEGGTAFYPNGFIEGNRMYLAYTYPSTIMGTTIEPLPDFSRPFLLPREGRSGLRLENDMAYFGQRWSSLGLVLTEALTRQAELTLSFRMNLYYRCESYFPLLTIGGKTRNGTEIRVEYDSAAQVDLIKVRTGSEQWEVIAPMPLREWFEFKVRITNDGFALGINGGEMRYYAMPVLRKLCFGGLYELPEWPMGVARSQEIRLDLASLCLS